MDAPRKSNGTQDLPYRATITYYHRNSQTIRQIKLRTATPEECEAAATCLCDNMDPSVALGLLVRYTALGDDGGEADLADLPF